MLDPNLTPTQKIIHLQKGTEDSTRRKIYYASLQGELLEKCFHQSKKVYGEILVEMKITMQWLIFLRKLYKLALDYNQITYCTVPLSYIRSNFKIIKEICECNKERWNFFGTLQARVSRLEPLNFSDFGDFNCCPYPSNIFFINTLD